MMYDEFISKTGIDIDYTTYTNGVEVVYRNIPEIVYGGNSNTDFCNWVKKNGGMKAIEVLYPLCDTFERYHKYLKATDETCESMLKSIDEKNRLLSEKDEKISKLESELNLYKQLVSKESLLKKLGELDCEQLLEAIDLSKLR